MFFSDTSRSRQPRNGSLAKTPRSTFCSAHTARHTPLGEIAFGEIAFRKGAEQIETSSAGFAETSFDERGYAR
jgi:hypothetical protein